MEPYCLAERRFFFIDARIAVITNTSFSPFLGQCSDRGGASAAVGFRDFMLKPEIIRAITECGFETPSEGTCPFHLLSANSK